MRAPTPCLSWKGPCSQHSTFAESAVFLKTPGTNGKYCDVVSGKMRCEGSKGTFTFKHEGESCTGNGKLVSLPSNADCRFDAAAAAPHVACGNQALGTPPAEVMISSNSLSTSRSGQVTIEFAPVGSSMQPLIAKKVSPEGWTTYDGTFTRTCAGAIRYIRSIHDNKKEDRTFYLSCHDPEPSYPNMGSFIPGGWSSPTAWDGEWTHTCGTNQVLSAMWSTHDNGREDRIFQFKCSTIPPGFTKSVGGWTGWSSWDQESLIDCGTAGAISGIISKHDNKKEDRIWRYLCATVIPVKPAPLTLEVEYSSALGATSV